MKKNLYIFYLLIVFINGCDLFSTRTPEPPINKKTAFIPPTSSDVVVKNLQSSISEKNVDNYIACLTDNTDITGKQMFSFIPTSDVFAVYSSVFQYWDLYAERRYFNTMINATPRDIIPDLKLYNQQTIPLQQDSVIYVFDYLLSVPHSVDGVPKAVSGRMQLTVNLKHTNGLWSISTWIDTKSSNDSLPYSWSFLKAKFSN